MTTMEVASQGLIRVIHLEEGSGGALKGVWVSFMEGSGGPGKVSGCPSEGWLPLDV